MQLIARCFSTQLKKPLPHTHLPPLTSIPATHFPTSNPTWLTLTRPKPRGGREVGGCRVEYFGIGIGGRGALLAGMPTPTSKHRVNI